MRDMLWVARHTSLSAYCKATGLGLGFKGEPPWCDLHPTECGGLPGWGGEKEQCVWGIWVAALAEIERVGKIRVEFRIRVGVPRWWSIFPNFPFPWQSFDCLQRKFRVTGFSSSLRFVLVMEWFSFVLLMDYCVSFRQRQLFSAFQKKEGAIPQSKADFALHFAGANLWIQSIKLLLSL